MSETSSMSCCLFESSQCLSVTIVCDYVEFKDSSVHFRFCGADNRSVSNVNLYHRLGETAISSNN